MINISRLSKIFIVLIFILPGLYLLLNFTTKEQLNGSFVFLIGGIILLWFEHNINNPFVQDIIEKYI